MSIQLNKYVKYGLILLLSVALILFTMEIKLMKNPGSTPITSMTFVGLGVLWLFSMIGIVISDLMQKSPVKIIRDFPILGWVSITSLILCLICDFFVQAIQAVDFLSITTPILTFAGISVANRLVDLRNTSWKVAIVAIFVFTGTYAGSALLAQIGLFLSGN
ncbi:hypothetical protein KM914_04945 [Virgibacillus pantothenticus]|uniref:Uncharacterized protein n=1 Tax=Virgibacillus pantothenticus TaxID=1473 RepID=A0A0L0QLR4_VIRPA|nr:MULTISPECIES: hypothetical protein [Virgibacillus]API93268.1 hypothetical protein BKP57_16470 [Virgibacillus sp. 6R]KNE19545.1 hypothetical protein AFK71_13785 [Virgibacillus pantothenticus]MBS7428685.1 hypothetical protein [Virgibacillus sp. 19R1-5]MBU8565786.1 hypothetical protein [Virgibacillus pantothenticus]MBU8599627.1 hypothetical protein [Virgibacillus pantothenticus]